MATAPARGGEGAAAAMTADEFRRLTGVSRETAARLSAYLELLRKWQRAINLVGRDSLADPWRRHMLDSAQLLPLLPAAPAGRPRVIADLGSGAGFPGLVLAILGAGEVHLIESDRRKCVFLAEAARHAGAAATVHPGRAEDLTPWPADVVTARALAPLTRLVGLARPYLGPGGVALFLKGAGVEEELTAARKEWNMRVERFPSRSSATGAILRVGDISGALTRR